MTRATQLLEKVNQPEFGFAEKDIVDELLRQLVMNMTTFSTYLEDPNQWPLHVQNSVGRGSVDTDKIANYLRAELQPITKKAADQISKIHVRKQ